MHLKVTGFTDIETNQRSSLDLFNRVDGKDLIKFEAKQKFYSWAQEQAAIAKFKSETDKQIWSHYSNGVTFRAMESKIGLDHTWIYRKVTKIKDYLKEQAQHITASMSYEAAVY